MSGAELPPLVSAEGGWSEDAPDVMFGGCITMSVQLTPIRVEDIGNLRDAPLTLQHVSLTVERPDGSSMHEPGILGVLDVIGSTHRVKVDVLVPLTFRSVEEAANWNQRPDEFLLAMGSWSRHVIWDFAALQARQASAANYSNLELPWTTPRVILQYKDGQEVLIPATRPAETSPYW